MTCTHCTNTKTLKGVFLNTEDTPEKRANKQYDAWLCPQCLRKAGQKSVGEILKEKNKERESKEYTILGNEFFIYSHTIEAKSEKEALAKFERMQETKNISEIVEKYGREESAYWIE